MAQDPKKPVTASKVIDEALKENFKATPSRCDFRFLGNSIPTKANTVFVNVSVRMASDSVSGIGVGMSNRYLHRMVWLTTQNAVFTALEKAQRAVPGADLSSLMLFRELVHLLGLKANPKLPLSEDYECTLQLGRLRSDDALRRPHALSTGYDDRFCGASSRRPFGSTADNRTGKAGLPEAICLSKDVEMFSDGPDYETFRENLSPLASWVQGTVGPIRAVLNGGDLFKVDKPYLPTLQAVIIKRLRQAKEGCGKLEDQCCCKPTVGR